MYGSFAWFLAARCYAATGGGAYSELVARKTTPMTAPMTNSPANWRFVGRRPSAPGRMVYKNAKQTAIPTTNNALST